MMLLYDRIHHIFTSKELFLYLPNQSRIERCILTFEFSAEITTFYLPCQSVGENREGVWSFKVLNIIIRAMKCI